MKRTMGIFLLCLMLLAGCGKKEPAKPSVPDLCFTMPREQVSQVTKGSYTILQYFPDYDSYNGILVNAPVMPDSEGVIRIPGDPNVFALRSDLGEVLPYSSFYQWDKGYYEATGALTVAGELSLYEKVTFGIREDTMELTLPEDVDFSKRDCLLLTDIHRTLKKDEQGNVQHLRQWETTFNIVWPSLSYKENFSLEQVPASSLAKELYLLVVMEDEENNLIYSHMEKLKDATPARQATVTTEKGTLTFSLNDGAATLTSYEGEDSAVTVPDTVEELPVKQIASGAFSNKSTVEEVTLPASLEQIGASAFYNCPITEITLPENLRTIGYNAFCNTPLETITLPKNVEYVAFGAFRNCYSLQDIHCKSEAYLEKDGVLFSADGKTLWAFPVGRYDFYEIPTGTELVATYAFAGARELTSVSFPEGLQRLEYRAFEAVNGLQELAFPQSLQYVGQEAFLEVISYGTDYTPADLGVITLGKNLTFVGTGAFDSFKFQGFAVEAGNPSYTAVDGCLYSADGKTLLRVPNGFVGDFTVPDTVTTLAKSAFADCKNMASLTVGAQVTNIEQLALASSVVVRCPAGSAMETYATGLGLTVEVQ